jgi:hypothetical protein
MGYLSRRHRRSGAIQISNLFRYPDNVQESIPAVILHFTNEYAPLLSYIFIALTAGLQVYRHCNLDVWLVAFLLVAGLYVTPANVYELVEWIICYQSRNFGAAFWYSGTKILLRCLQPYIALAIEGNATLIMLAKFLFQCTTIAVARAYFGPRDGATPFLQGRSGIWPPILLHLGDIYLSRNANWVSYMLVLNFHFLGPRPNTAHLEAFAISFLVWRQGWPPSASFTCFISANVFFHPFVRRLVAQASSTSILRPQRFGTLWFVGTYLTIMVGLTNFNPALL